MKIFCAYKTELKPNNKQKTLLAKNSGTARFAYNWALNIKKQAFDKKEKIPNYIELSRKLNQLKQDELSWMYEASKCSPLEALRNCDKAFDNFFHRCKKKTKGKKGFPKFKSKKNGLGNFKLTGIIKVFDKYIQLPRLGEIKLKEKNYLPNNKKIFNATISEKAGKWFVSILVEEDINPVIKQEAIIGLDLGIKTLAVTNEGEIFDNPKALRNNLKLLQRRSKQLSKKIKESKNRSKARKKLAKLHYKIANIRKDNLHKITSYLTKTKSKIIIEDLNINGLLKNRKLSRAIADSSLYELRRQLEYKGKWYGCEIQVVDKFYPSSKLCSNCGKKKDNLTLKDRIYKCVDCGLEIDRDLNAAINLRNYNTVRSTGINAFGEVSSDSKAILSETDFCELGTKH